MSSTATTDPDAGAGADYLPCLSPEALFSRCVHDGDRLAHLAALSGTVRGVALRNWHSNVGRRFGPAVARSIHDALLDLGVPVAPAPASSAALPIAAPVLVAALVVHYGAGGDWSALAPAMAEDIHRGIPVPGRLALRLLGPDALVARAPALHRRLYDVGSAALAAQTMAGEARIVVRGHPLFAEARWQVLQLFGLRIACGLAGARRPVVSVQRDAAEGCTLLLQPEAAARALGADGQRRP